jgi:hypothetical protein
MPRIDDDMFMQMLFSSMDHDMTMEVMIQARYYIRSQLEHTFIKMKLSFPKKLLTTYYPIMSRLTILLIPLILLSSCTIDWNDEKDAKITELEKQIQDDTFKKKQEC